MRGETKRKSPVKLFLVFECREWFHVEGEKSWFETCRAQCHELFFSFSLADKKGKIDVGQHTNWIVNATVLLRPDSDSETGMQLNDRCLLSLSINQVSAHFYAQGELSIGWHVVNLPDATSDGSHQENWIIESAHLRTGVDSQKWYKLVSREKTKIHHCCFVCLLAQLNPDKHRSVLDSSIVSFFRLLTLVLHVGVATTIKKKDWNRVNKL